MRDTHLTSRRGVEEESAAEARPSAGDAVIRGGAQDPRGDDTARSRSLTRLVDACLALSAGGLAGLIAHRLAGDEPIAAEGEYAGHLFAELLIVVFAAIIVYWLLEDFRSARRRDH